MSQALLYKALMPTSVLNECIDGSGLSACGVVGLRGFESTMLFGLEGYTPLDLGA